MLKPIPVRVLIESCITAPDGTVDTLRQTHRGSLHCASDGATSLRYTEESESGRTLSEVAVSPDGTRVTINRRGAVCTYMEFAAGKTHQTLYEVPPYRFDMEIACHTLRASMGMFGGQVRLEYTHRVGGEENRIAFLLTATVGGKP